MSRSLSSVQKAVEEALHFGYQINPDALKLLQKLVERRRAKPGESEPSLEVIVRGVIDKKAKEQLGETIESSDLNEVFPELFDFVEDSQTRVEASVVVEKVNTSNKPDVEIIEDPSLDIQPTGVEGFSQLFKSRYEKIVHILMERPEARQLTKISKVNMEKGNVKIAGLVFSKKPTKTGGIEFTLDDDTGNTSVLALSPRRRKVRVILLWISV